MKILTEYGTEEFLARVSFPVANRRLFLDEREAYLFANKIGFPVVLKVVSDKLVHKSEINAVRLDVYRDNFFSVFRELSKMKLEKDGIAVQKFIHGKHILIGLKKDETFGHVIAVGLGGIYAEIIKDVSIRIVPINRTDAADMLKELKSYEILKGFRGEKADINLIADVIIKVSRLAQEYPNIIELDINPLIVNFSEAKIVDARIVTS